MTSNDLHEAVRNTYPAPNFMYLKEVRDATGFDAVRSADAIAIGMYRSCGRLIHGFEMKVSRTDWQKELKNAAKAESLMRYCHRWSLIVPDASIVHPGELPTTWGLGVWNQSRKNALPKVKWVVPPPTLEPIPMSMVFLTAMVYGVSQNMVATNQAAVEDALARGKELAEKRMGDDRDTDALKRLRTAVQAFDKASGIHISEYTGERSAEELGESFREWSTGVNDMKHRRNELQRMRATAKQISDQIEKSLDRLGGKDLQPAFKELMGEATA